MPDSFYERFCQTHPELNRPAGASLGVAIIGKSLAQALLPKHAIKQVDRLLSNRKLEAIFATWVPELVGSRTDLIVAMDWTDFDADGHLALKLVTAGRRRWSGSACSRTSCAQRL